jgi:ABC-2 type transport system ATP-binding protein/lipopolysaccharide transport system ATP-binding protein
MALVIQAQQLSKRYRLGEGGYVTLREQVSGRLPRRGRSEVERRQDVWALRDVDLEIEEGDVVGIVGRNGAGKTTLLKTVARIVRPTTGVVRLRGRVGALLEVGTGFHPELTGRENVYLNGVVLGMSRREIRQRFDDIVEFAGVERFLDTPLKRYSSGMYLRLAFAVAAHVDPDILIVDEVLAVGDAEFQRRCLGRMSEFGREGRTVLFVSHDTGAVGRLCKRGIWLDRGKIQTFGDAHSVIDEYLGTLASRGARAEVSLAAGGPISGLSIALVDRNGSPVERIRRDEPLCFDIALSLTEAHPGLDLGLYVLTEDRTQLLSDTTSEHGVTIRESGRYAVRVTIPNVLAAATYVAGIRLASEAAMLLHEEVLEFIVTPRPDDKGTRLGRLIQPTVRWDVTKAGL